jgi:hypothetical protein
MKRKIDDDFQEIQSTDNKHRKIFHTIKRSEARNKRKMIEIEDENTNIKRMCNTDILKSAYARYFEEVYKTYCDPDQESFVCEKFEESQAYYIY